MPSKITRTSLSLPREVLARADALARAAGRPRSWVFAEALRRWEEPGFSPLPAPAEEAPPDQCLAFRTWRAYQEWVHRTAAVSAPRGGLRRAEACRALHSAGVKYLLVERPGGAGKPADVPVVFLIERAPAEVRALLRALAGVGLVLAREWLAELVVERAATVIGTAPRVDVLTEVAGGDYESWLERATTKRMGGIPVAVVTPTSRPAG